MARRPAQDFDIVRFRRDPRERHKLYGRKEFKHSVSKKFLWNDGFYTPSFIGEALIHSESANGNNAGIVFLALLRDCTKNKDLCGGIRLHEDILRQDLLKKCSDGLINMYARCDALEEARDLFEIHKSKDAFTWTALIAGYVHVGQAQYALDIFDQMQREGLSPNAVTYACVLKACGNLRAADRGHKIHDEIFKRGILRSNVELGNSLVGMYVKFGDLIKAQRVLEELPVRNVISWTTLISGYAEHGKGEEALNCFEEMRRQGVSPNEVTFTCLLKACGSMKALGKGEKIHDEISKQGLLKKSVVLGTALVDMYAKCGALGRARCVLEEMPVRNAISWNVLITRYAERGEGEQALDCLEQMDREGISPDVVTFAGILKACGSVRALDMGEQIHDKIAKQGLLGDSLVLGNALVDMYAKCGALIKARKVLLELPVRNAISWNALIAAYAEHGEGELALECSEEMQREGIPLGAVTFACMLKACGSIGATEKGVQIHDEIARQGLLKNDVVLGTALVDMYAKCGALAKARQVLEDLPVRDVICWTSLIAGYVDNEEDEQALLCFEQMQREGLSPSAVTFSCVLKTCGNIGAADKGEKIHDEIAKQGLLGSNVVLGYALVDMYAKCGALGKAQRILEELPTHNVISWNALIVRYTEHGEGEQALNCFDKMVSEGLSPDSVTFSCILKVCGSIGAADKGERIHEEIAKQGLLEKDIKIGTALVDMYTKCGLRGKARQVLEALPIRDVFSWTALIMGYAEHGEAELIWDCFEQMQSEGFFPDAVMFTCILKACSCIGAVDWGKKIHHEIAKGGLLGIDSAIGTALVDMYAKCGALTKARQVLEELSNRDVHSWNALMAGYTEQGKVEETFTCFEQMQSEGLSPDAATFVYILKACGSTGATGRGAKYHDEIAKQGLLGNNVYLGTGLVDMYAKCGALSKARDVLENSQVQDIMAWNSLIAGYVEHGECKHALNAFEQLQHGGLSPNAVTFACVLKVCGSVGAVCKGEMIYHEIAKQELLKNDIFLGNAVVDMYGKCGALTKARQVLDELPVRDASSWNALMVGLIQQGESAQALTCFEQMLCEGLSPNAATFTCILNACSRLGLVDNAQMHFLDMDTKYGLKPELEHYSCIVDAYGRAGNLDKAVKMTEEMPSSLGGVWSTLLGACQRWGDVYAGRWAFEHAVQLDDADATIYHIMASIYSSAAVQEDGKCIEAMRIESIVSRKRVQIL